MTGCQYWDFDPNDCPLFRSFQCPATCEREEFNDYQEKSESINVGSRR